MTAHGSKYVVIKKSGEILGFDNLTSAYKVYSENILDNFIYKKIDVTIIEKKPTSET